MTARWVRWIPAFAAPAVIAAGALVVPLAANAAVDLPAKSAEQLLEMTMSSTVHAFSGTIEQSADLGLPELPAIGPAASSTTGASDSESGAGVSINSALEFLSGTHTARVFVDGPTKTRVQVMDSLAERDLIRNGSDVWFYDSAQNTATQLELPQGAPSVPNGAAAVKTPKEIADHFLASVGPTTTVAVGDDSRVAGRPVYELILTPNSTDTLVGSVSVSVDSETGLPLQVLIQARGQETPAFRVTFSAVTLTTPSASLFEFTPPDGATVTQQALPDLSKSTSAPVLPDTQPTVTGTGWDSVVSMPTGTDTTALLDSPLLDQLTTSVTGGRLLSTALVNVFLSHDGRVFAGAVPLAVLQNAAAAW